MPQVAVTAGLTALTGVASLAQIGLAVRVILLQPTSDGGLQVGPWFLPPDIDVTRPVSLRARITSSPSGAPAPGNIEWQVGYAWAGLGGWNETTFQLIQPIDATFIVSATLPLLLDNGAGYTIAGGVLPVGTCLSLLLRRMGSLVGDTYVRLVYLSPTLDIVYYKRCQAVCC